MKNRKFICSLVIPWLMVDLFFSFDSLFVDSMSYFWVWVSIRILTTTKLILNVNDKTRVSFKQKLVSLKRTLIKIPHQKSNSSNSLRFIFVDDRWALIWSIRNFSQQSHKMFKVQNRNMEWLLSTLDDGPNHTTNQRGERIMEYHLSNYFFSFLYFLHTLNAYSVLIEKGDSISSSSRRMLVWW